MWNSNYIAKLEDLRQRVNEAGGAKRVEKQHEAGKMTARERLNYLFDSGTFHEVNNLVETTADAFGLKDKVCPGDGVITGYGEINGRLVFASSQDFTVVGGALGEMHAEKICRIMDMAIEMRAPFINLDDSGGARIEEGICALNGYGGIFYRNTKASGLIPQIAVILGPCAGGACYSPAICDFIFMTRTTSKMFITGPNVIKQVTGENVTFEELGGATMHEHISGCSHFVYDNDKECLDGVRRLLDYLPANNGENPPIMQGYIPSEPKELQDVVPDNQRKTYDVHEVIDTILDASSFMEVHRSFAQNIVVGFGRMAGKVVGIVANQPNFMGGCLDVNASDKSARFIRFCDCFNIPLVALVDVPGFLPGINQERNGIIRHGAKMLFAFSEATVPKITVILRKAYGGAYIAMNSIKTGADMVFAWPIAQIAVMGADGAVEIIYKKDILAAANPAQRRQELQAQYDEYFMNPYIAAKRGYVNEVIMPGETRNKIIAALHMLKSKKASQGCGKKHGNIPL